ncbi:MAG TPA: peptide ABC transporter substrate-binding protein [Dongiaceae bacterium]|nr:peptide ABC transporter substrate-binding protein [Dongiaceae bacterium]
MSFCNGNRPSVRRAAALNSAKSALFGAVLVAAGAALAASASAESTLVRGMGPTIGTLDPQLNFLANEGWIQDDMYEGLTAQDASGNIIPGAADKWELSDDGLTYTFHLRDGLKWSNGDPLVAQDFVNGVVRTVDPATASDKAYIFCSTIAVTGVCDFTAKKTSDPTKLGISAPDAKTVVVKLDKPAPYALIYFGSYYGAPLHKPSFDKFGAAFIKPENIVSNGAYHMAENVPQSHVTLVKNPNFWDAANVKIDKVVYQITEDNKTAVKLFKSGQLDVGVDIPADDVLNLQKEFGDEMHVTPYLETDYFSFNIKVPPFDNINIRKALSTALDRDTFINKVIKGGYVVNCGYVVPLPDYKGARVPECDMDQATRIKTAKALLAQGMKEANIKKLSFTIESSNDDTQKKIAETAALMWKKALGVDVKVNAQERDAWLDAFNGGKWQVFNDDLVGDFAGPETFLAYIDPRGGVYGWESKEYEDLWDKAMLAADKQQRYALLAQAEKVFLDQYTSTPLDAAPSRDLVSKKISGWVDNVGASHPTRFMTISGN